MDKSKNATSSHDRAENNAKRLKAIATLLVHHDGTKVALAKVLKSLNDTSALRNDVLSSSHSLASYRRQVQRVFDELAFRTPTLYGTLLRELRLPIINCPTPKTITYIDPFAFLSFVCSHNRSFFDLIKQLPSPAKLVINVDEVNPGNALAPDPQLLVQAVYWILSDFPQWFLSRKDSWFVFS